MTNNETHTHLYKPNKLGVLIIIILSLFLIYYNKSNIRSSNDNILIYKAKVLEISSEENVIEEYSAKPIHKQNLVVEIKTNDETQTTNVINDIAPVKKGDNIYVQSYVYENQQVFNIVTIDKSNGIKWLALIFVTLLIIVSGKKGIYALAGLLFSLSIIFHFIIPRILNGSNPIITALIGAIITLIGTLYVSYGFNKKSISAFLGITITLIFVGIAANYSIYQLHFSGFGSEESIYLNSETGENINLIGLVIAGIIIAAIGILDDIAITQASIVLSLASTNRSLHGLKLFKEAMEIGKDHISAVVNTLVLAYTGAALPALLLFNLISLPVNYTLSLDTIAEEIVRTLISTSGLVMAVPITTLIAVLLKDMHGSSLHDS